MSRFFPALDGIRLGVNIDHIATLRNVRGTDYPSPLKAALAAEEAGADLITLHLREDRRHIREADVEALREQLQTKMNLECAMTPEMLEFACRIKPQDVCLVPEKRHELTTEGGLDVVGQLPAVQAACAQLEKAGIRVALFIDADEKQIQAAHAVGAPVIELHTGEYANATDDSSQQQMLERIQRGADLALSLGLRVHAGHGLHYGNVQCVAAMESIEELNIGHAIVAHALFVGWENAVREMKALMVKARLALQAAQ